MVKIGGSKKQIMQKNENKREFINFVEIGGIDSMHHRLRGDGCPEKYFIFFVNY